MSDDSFWCMVEYTTKIQTYLSYQIEHMTFDLDLPFGIDVWYLTVICLSNSISLLPSFELLPFPQSPFLFVEPPSAPQGLHVVNTGDGTVDLAWKAASADSSRPVTDYIIQAMRMDGDRGGYSNIGTVNGNTLKFEAVGLQTGLDYMFKVKAVNPSGTSVDGSTLEKPIRASKRGEG